MINTVVNLLRKYTLQGETNVTVTWYLVKWNRKLSIYW